MSPTNDLNLLLTMAADLLMEFTKTNMSFNHPFLQANSSPRVDPAGFEVSSADGPNLQEIEVVQDYMQAFDEGAFEDLSQSMIVPGNGASGGLASRVMKFERELKRMKMDNRGHRIGFRTKSEVEILDDGFKWRKYGKKSVKNSPNPRNYYRCSSEGCGVKKRVERDSEDPCYVVTTYEGVHNHPSPGQICCGLGAHYQHLAEASNWSRQMQVVAPNPWSAAQSATSSC